MPILQVGANAENSEMPRAVLAGVQPDCPEEWSVGGVAIGQEMCFGLGREILSEERVVQALAGDDVGLHVPACRRTGASEGKVDEVDDRDVVGFNGTVEEHLH